MKTVNLTMSEAIEVMANTLAMGNSIPCTSDGQGGTGFGMLDPDFSIKEAAALWLKYGFDYRVVPASEISDEFKGNVDFDDYDVCVEFEYKGTRAQFLLWDINNIIYKL